MPFLATDCLILKGHEDSKDGQNYPWNTNEENGGVSSPGNEMVSLFIIHKDQFPEVNDTAFSNGIPQDLRTGQDTAKYQEESQNSTPSGDVPMVEVQPRISSRPV